MKRLAKQTFLVGAGKGGVGKSTVALNLAIALSKKGFQVALLDADLYGPSLPILAGLRNLSPPRIGDNQVTPFSKFGLSLISLGFFLEEARAIVWRGPMLHAMLNRLIQQVAWPELDYLFVDLPPGTGDVPLSLSKLLAIDGSLLITTPQQVAFLDVAKAAHAFQLLQIPLSGLIENMVGYPFGKSRGATYAAQLKIPFLGAIPLHEGINLGSEEGIPFAFQQSQDPFFHPLADNLLEKYGEEKRQD